MTPVNLGKKYDSVQCCAPMPSGKNDVHFTSVYLDAAKLPDIPRAGTITFRYELCTKSEDLKNDKSNVNLDLLQIVEVKPDAKVEKLVSTEERLDKLRAELVGDDDDDEPKGSDREQYAEET